MSPASASATPPPLPPDAVADNAGMPMRFGKYTLIRKLAVGGMAELFLALQRSMAGFEKLIVVKRVLPHLVKDESFIQMLLAEARIAATLNHPNVAHIYDVGEVGGQFYIAMEHIHGEDLRSIVRQMKKEGVNSFPLEHALAIVLGCCAGLAYAHEKRDLDGEPMGIVHRDVSPQNILVTFTGDVKLVDFGIAKAGRSSMEDTGSGQLKGKVPYMSPEQAQGEHLDGRSDIFSLGIMLFELCTGRRLFRGKNEMETLRKIVEEPYPRPRELNPHLSPRLEAIILRSLEKDLSRRYQSAREMQTELEEFIRSEQLKVSALSLGSWMQNLFRNKLDQQKQMLQEGRQLAEVIAAQAEEEERELETSGGTLGSRVRAKPASKVPWILLVLMMLGGMGAAAWLFTRPSTDVPTGPGVMHLATNPPGAAIWVDGDRRPERTPTTLRELPVGATYSVKLSLDGYLAHTEDVQLTEVTPEHRIDTELRRPSASDFAVLRVQSTPPGASILIGGRDTEETTPATIPELPPGERISLVLTLDGYVTRNETLNLEAGEVTELNFELERTPLGANESLLRVTTEPANARLIVDGTTHDGGSPYELRLPARRTRVIINHPGYRSAERDVTLVGTEVSELSIELERDRRGPRPPSTPSEPATPTSNEPGQLTFSSTPWCQVTINGSPVGQTPIVGHTLPPGRHTVVCTNPEAGSERVIVNIAPGQHVRRRITLQ